MNSGTRGAVATLALGLAMVVSGFHTKPALGQASRTAPERANDRPRREPYGVLPAEGIFPLSDTTLPPPCSVDLPSGTVCVWPGPTGYLIAPDEEATPKYFSKEPTRQTRPYAIFLGKDGRDFRMVGSSIVLYSVPMGTRCDFTQSFVLEIAADYFTRDCAGTGTKP